MFGSWDKAQEEAVKKARQYCVAKGETYAFISKHRSGTPGFTPQKSTITFTCGPDVAVQWNVVTTECKDDMQIPALDPIRGKVKLSRDSWESAVPFAIAVNDTLPTPTERDAIAKWATIREACVKREHALIAPLPSAAPLQVTQFQQDVSFGQAASVRVGDLIVAPPVGRCAISRWRDRP